MGITWTTASTYSGPHYATTRKLLQGQKRYELSNHLGNVLATINDRRVPQDGAVTDNVAEFYTALTLSAQDYYPFGMEMPGRTFVLGAGLGSRYGFNGKEKDPTEFGSLTHYDYGFRIYNPAIGKFLSVDAMRRDYPFYGPYNFAGNKPIVAIDLDGLQEKWVTIKEHKDLFGATHINRRDIQVKVDKDAILENVETCQRVAVTHPLARV